MGDWGTILPEIGLNSLLTRQQPITDIIDANLNDMITRTFPTFSLAELEVVWKPSKKLAKIYFSNSIAIGSREIRRAVDEVLHRR
jgi:hypothetical protein